MRYLAVIAVICIVLVLILGWLMSDEDNEVR